MRLRLLGRFAVTVEREGAPPDVIDVAGKLRRALLGYLAMQPGFAETRERLATLLWGDSPDKQARQSLRQCLLDLRRDFQDIGLEPLKIDRDTIALDADLVNSDAREFLDLARSDAADERERAAALHAGIFLDGVDLDVEPFDQWLRDERVRIEQAAGELFEHEAARHAAAGDGPQALRAAERLVAIDPFREASQRLLLRLIASYRGRDAALAQAETFAALIKREFGAQVEAETAALVGQIRDNAVQETSGKPQRAAPDWPEPLSVPAAAAIRRPSRAAWANAAVLGFAALAIAISIYPRSHSSGVPADPSWQPPALQPGVSAAKRELAAEGISPLVVLPFASDAGAGRSGERAAERVTNDLIAELSRVPALRVISRMTSQLYRDKKVDVAVIGADLGVPYAVEGEVHIDGARMRINVALTDTKTRLQMWSAHFERDSAEQAAMQGEIARSLARHLHVSILETEEGRRPPVTARNAEVSDLVAKGWGAMLRAGHEPMNTTGADRYFEQALARDADNASALVGLGGYHAAIAADFLASDPAPHLARAREVLDKALLLQPDNSIAHYFMGVVEKVRGEPQAALVSFARSIELNPSFAPGYANYAHVLYRTGKLDEAMENVRYALKLSPKDPNLGRWALYAGEIEIERGNDEAAIEWLQRSITTGAGSTINSAILAAAYSLHGDVDRARQLAAKVHATTPWLTLPVMLDRLVGMSRQGAEPRRLIAGLRDAFTDATSAAIPSSTRD